MISRLRRRLTLLMTAMTALVLAGALLVTWRLSEEQYRRSAEQLFENNFSSLCDRLADADSVSDVWLAEQEQSTECLLFLKDNGASLHYEGSLASRTPRSELEALVLEAVGQLLDTSPRGPSFVRKLTAPWPVMPLTPTLWLWRCSPAEKRVHT